MSYDKYRKIEPRWIVNLDYTFIKEDIFEDVEEIISSYSKTLYVMEKTLNIVCKAYVLVITSIHHYRKIGGLSFTIHALLTGSPFGAYVGAMLFFWAFVQFYDDYVKKFIKTFMIFSLIGVFICIVVPYKMKWNQDESSWEYQTLSLMEDWVITVYKYGGFVFHDPELTTTQKTKEFIGRLVETWVYGVFNLIQSQFWFWN
jgi:hypothetical protein